ncbi:hypothetical protein X798_00731 [Onchocerca flexuosa]|uniref:DM domain-containing protein n=1 Tax=Onchocerca flexuosa TaxID=387005 RepID=A0A238C5B7_9BILA|nr:hypothetical protein X798_00731 [Onchocerca flexuosa]
MTESRAPISHFQTTVMPRNKIINNATPIYIFSCISFCSSSFAKMIFQDKKREDRTCLIIESVLLYDMPKEQYMCQLCANHGIFNQPKKGHKQKCPYRHCPNK